MTRIPLHWQILIAMSLGASIGLVLNIYGGEDHTDAPVVIEQADVQPYGMTKSVRIQAGTIWASDSPHEIHMQISQPQAQGTRRIFVGVLGEAATEQPKGEQLVDVFEQDANAPPLPANETISEVIAPSLKELKKLDAEAYVLFQRHGRSPARTVGDLGKRLGDLFLRLLKMVSVPLILFSLASGVLGLGQADRLGKMFGRTLLYYVSTSLLAILTGLFMVNLIRPGADDARQVPDQLEQAREQGKQLSTVLFEQLENLIPVNPIQATADGQFLGIIAFSLAFSIFTLLVGGQTAETVRGLATAGFSVMMRMTMAIVRLAPLGVFCLMLFAAATQGIEVFGRLGWYMLTVACALVFHAVVILPLILKFVAKRSPLEFAKAMSPALFTAFSSASSNATLPLTLTSVEQRAGVSNRVSSFVLPLGATVNMDGTALYEVVAVFFIANLTPGVELGMMQQISVVFTALLASIGAAGIPHAGLVMMVIILQAVGLPTESQGLIIAVDRILDMCRTCVNVWSDSCGCAVIARFDRNATD